MPCGWEGNRRSGVALAMRHRLQWFIHLQAHGLRKGDEHFSWHMAHFTFLLAYLNNSTLRHFSCKLRKQCPLSIILIRSVVK